MISIYGGAGDRRTGGDRGPGGPRRPDVPDYPDIPEHPDHPEYPEPPGHTHRYWIAGLEILDDGLMNTAWQANR